jgi:ferritin-like metal-binding protein YciE
MDLNEIFDQEDDFQMLINQLLKTELKLQSIYPKMAQQATEAETKRYFSSLTQQAKDQIIRLEELCEIYDINLDSLESFEINAMMLEAEKMSLKNNDLSNISITDHELVQTAEKIKLQEKYFINSAINLAQQLHYMEAIDILSFTNPEIYYKVNAG